MKDDGHKGICEGCGEGDAIGFGVCMRCFDRERDEIRAALAELREVKRRHSNIVGLLVGNPAANAAERLRHLRIEGLLAA